MRKLICHFYRFWFQPCWIPIYIWGWKSGYGCWWCRQEILHCQWSWSWWRFIRLRVSRDAREVIHRDLAASLGTRGTGLRRPQQRRTQDKLSRIGASRDHSHRSRSRQLRLASWPHCYLLIEIFYKIFLKLHCHNASDFLYKLHNLPFVQLHKMKICHNQLTTFAQNLYCPWTFSTHASVLGNV